MLGMLARHWPVPLRKKNKCLHTHETVFGRLSFLSQPFGLHSLSQDFHQRIQQNWDGSKAATPKCSSSMGKQPWDRSGRVKPNRRKTIFCALDIIKFGNLLAQQDAGEDHRLKFSLAHPSQMARTAQEVFGLVNQVWVFAQLNMSAVSTSELWEETSNRTGFTR